MKFEWREVSIRYSIFAKIFNLDKNVVSAGGIVHQFLDLRTYINLPSVGRAYAPLDKVHPEYDTLELNGLRKERSNAPPIFIFSLIPIYITLKPRNPVFVPRRRKRISQTLTKTLVIYSTNYPGIHTLRRNNFRLEGGGGGSSLLSDLNIHLNEN